MNKDQLVSSRQGHSEHQTGLAVDVTGADGRCPASACFAGTRPARWLTTNASRFGFIVRYPAGAERVTGYAHEPWHLRYLGRRLAADVAASGLPYESYVASHQHAIRALYGHVTEIVTG